MYLPIPGEPSHSGQIMARKAGGHDRVFHTSDRFSRVGPGKGDATHKILNTTSPGPSRPRSLQIRPAERFVARKKRWDIISGRCFVYIAGADQDVK